ncbi:MAG TPA: hypothetical protein VFH89_11395 [Sphingomicrobium sp.]|nr:hypothetical protein [Sphingomicrobium sp.]
MLIDIFARRYEGAPLRDAFEERDRRLLVQATRILNEDVCPYPKEAKNGSVPEKFWTALHSRLSRELGLTELAPQWVFWTSKWNGNDVQQSYQNNASERCEKWMLAASTGDVDRHIKERLSLVELGFRQREEDIAVIMAEPIKSPKQPPLPVAGVGRLPMASDFGEQIRQMRSGIADAFRQNVEELNARFRQAGFPLHYHNGFIQVLTDELVQTNVENPFWTLVAEPRWVNVDTDMKEALDLRDSDGRDPSFYAARSLESAIKIICGLKGWTTGKERGAYNFIDHLGAKKNAFIDTWEVTSLKEFFTHVRNPFGHGPGSETMPGLTRQQTEWAIEFSMSWIKSLIRRL